MSTSLLFVLCLLGSLACAGSFSKVNSWVVKILLLVFSLGFAYVAFAFVAIDLGAVMVFNIALLLFISKACFSDKNTDKSHRAVGVGIIVLVALLFMPTLNLLGIASSNPLLTAIGDSFLKGWEVLIDLLRRALGTAIS